MYVQTSGVLDRSLMASSLHSLNITFSNLWKVNELAREKVMKLKKKYSTLPAPALSTFGSGKPPSDGPKVVVNCEQLMFPGIVTIPCHFY